MPTPTKDSPIASGLLQGRCGMILCRLTARRSARPRCQTKPLQYPHGVADQSRISLDSWLLQRALLARPGNKDAMADLRYDYRTNLPLYPKWQEYFRRHQPPAQIVWGKNDIIFPPLGADPYRKEICRRQYPRDGSFGAGRLCRGNCRPHQTLPHVVDVGRGGLIASAKHTAWIITPTGLPESRSRTFQARGLFFIRILCRSINLVSPAMPESRAEAAMLGRHRTLIHLSDVGASNPVSN